MNAVGITNRPSKEYTQWMQVEGRRPRPTPSGWPQHIPTNWITHTKTSLVQSNEYYPFGMQTANSWTRENATVNNFLANGGTELNSVSQLYDLDYRNYDPILARMNQSDPMSDKYSSLTPYNYAFNSPAVMNDVNGADPYRGVDWWSYNYNPKMDGRFGRTGGSARPDPDHPFAGWSGGFGGRDQFGMYGDIPFGAGSGYQMQVDAQAVRDGRMSINAYASLYGQSVAEKDFAKVLDSPVGRVSVVMSQNGNNYAYNIFVNALNKVLYADKASVRQDNNGAWYNTGSTSIIEFGFGGQTQGEGSGSLPGLPLGVVETSLMSGGITLPGIGIFVEPNSGNLTKHEVGHYLQFLRDGGSYFKFYKNIGAPSLYNAIEQTFVESVLGIDPSKVGLSHDNFRTETDANKLIFGPNGAPGYPTNSIAPSLNWYQRLDVYINILWNTR